MRPVDELVEAISIAPVFARLSPAARRQLAHTAKAVEVRGGEVVVRRGDAGDCCFAVRSGVLEVLDAEERHRVRVLRAGALFGELALLSGQPRTATVRAVRDCELWLIPRGAFDALLESDSEFARAMVYALTALVFESRADRQPDPETRVFSVVALHEHAPLEPVVEGCTALLGPSAAVFRRLDGPETAWGRALETLEPCATDVVLVAEASRDRWFDFCVREADRVVAVARVDAPLAPLPGAAAPDLVLVGKPRAGDVSRSRRAVAARAHHLVADAHDADAIARCLRRVAGRSVGVVLSGGGARGLAHVGVLAALADGGITVDRFGGTSMGALVGALAAQGLSWPEIRVTLRSELAARKPFSDWAVPRVSLIRGHRARAMLERVCGSTAIENLPYDYFCVSADLVAAAPVVHRTGQLVQAVGASMSLPGLAPPVRDGEKLLVDGGILDNLPVAEMTNTEEGPVVAVDVVGRSVPGAKRGAGRLPSIVETLARSVSLAGRRRAEHDRELAAVTIVPDLDHVGLLDFARFDAIIDAGRRAADAALAHAELTEPVAISRAAPHPRDR